MRRPSLLPVLTVAGLVPLLLGGCGQARDAAGAAATNAATQARDDATNKVKNAAQQQALKSVCRLVTGSGPLSDGAVSDEDRVLVSSVATLATSAGLPASYTAPLATLASTQSGEPAAATAIAELRKNCG